MQACFSPRFLLQLVGSAKVDIEDLLAVLGQYGSKCKRNTGGGGAFKGCKAGAKCGPFIAEAAEGTGHNKCEWGVSLSR